MPGIYETWRALPMTAGIRLCRATSQTANSSARFLQNTDLPQLFTSPLRVTSIARFAGLRISFAPTSTERFHCWRKHESTGVDFPIKIAGFFDSFTFPRMKYLDRWG